MLRSDWSNAQFTSAIWEPIIRVLYKSVIRYLAPGTIHCSYILVRHCFGGF